MLEKTWWFEDEEREKKKVCVCDPANLERERERERGRERERERERGGLSLVIVNVKDIEKDELGFEESYDWGMEGFHLRMTVMDSNEVKTE